MSASTHNSYMARKRSRANTELRFQDAVNELITESGCAQLGINLLAQIAGSDKVLIYRYFGGLDGLLQRVAESRLWLPTADDLLSDLAGQPKHILAKIADLVTQHVRTDAATHQLCLWRHAVKNPLTEQYTSEWKCLWQDLTEKLGSGLSYDERQNWAKACALLALIIESDLMDEAVDLSTLDSLTEILAPIDVQEAEDAYQEERLPTNLL
ncbi:MAG: TetR/AcrR family transcriptional regulator [Opitutales bacterium]